jgi:glycosyltransferase involved in cell wall biosynthesis
MKILHVCDWHLKYATWLSHGMAEAGADVALLTRTHDQEFGDNPGEMRAFVAAHAPDVRHLLLDGRTRDARSALRVAGLRRALRRFGPDVVHYQETVGTDPRLMLAGGLPRRRFAVTVHDPVPHPGDEWPLSRRLGLQLLLRRAGLVFVHSESLREEMVAEMPGSAPIEVVAHGIAAPRPAPLPERLNLLFFGRIATHYKGLDVLLDAMPAVWERVPEVTLTIAGSGELDPHPSLDDDRVVIRNAHVPDAELPELFGQATCCVLPYRQASQSGVGSHALAFARAVVVTDVGGLPDLARDGAGRVVPAGDARALADAIVEVVGTPGLAAQMSATAAARAQDAAWPRVGQRMIDAYRRHLPQVG